jgi:phosphoglycolate phosphatase
MGAPPPGLVLFDIDATMIRSDRMGVRAMEDVADMFFGPAVTDAPIEYAGRLDPLIIRDLAAARAAVPTPVALARFRAEYARRLRELLASATGGVYALTGVAALLDALQRRRDVTLGVLTGNFEETGALKLEAAGIGLDRFEVRVWGDASKHDPPAREHLPPVGMAQHAELVGAHVAPHRVAIIGDTPHDVACAKANNCRVLGVATGRFSKQQLAEAGADLALDDLSDTQGVAKWITTATADPTTR